MVIRHGRNVAIWINGVDVSGDLNEVSPTSEQELNDITVFGHIGTSAYPGLARDTGTIAGLYDNTEKAVFEGLVQVATGYGMAIAFGSAIGAPSYATDEINLRANSIRSIVSDVNRVSVSFETDNYPFEACKLLSSGKQTVAALSTGQNASLDNGSASGTTGGAWYLHVFQATPSISFTIQTSSTGLFAGEEGTAATAGPYDASTYERRSISSQIERYARLAWVNTGSTAVIGTALKRY